MSGCGQKKKKKKEKKSCESVQRKGILCQLDVFWMESGRKGGIGTAGTSSVQTTWFSIFFCFISFVFLVLSLGFSWMDLVLL